MTPSSGTEIKIEFSTDRSVSAAACGAHLATYRIHIGKTIEFVFLLCVAFPHSNCNDPGHESVFDVSDLQLKENCICIFLVRPYHGRGGANS